MIKAIVFILFIVLNVVSSDLKKMRHHFALMSKQEVSVTTIKELALTSNEVSVNLKRAYFAAAEMASAQYKSSPISKLNTFKRGKNILETTILADTSNVETRYIRYTIQQNAPSFLGYNKSLVSDKYFLIRQLSSIKAGDSELFSNVYAFLLTYGKLSQQEKALIDQ